MYTNKIALEKTIELLLQRYECVILPDFGGFIVRDSPCNFNASKDALKPFAKHIFFNPHLTQNDGLLISELQKSKPMTYNEAIEVAKTSIDEIKSDIEQNGNRTFGQLGTFHKGQSNVWFSPNTNLNLSTESYGLASVDLKLVRSNPELLSDKVQEPTEFKSEIVPDKSPIVSIEIPKRGLKPWLVAASIALLAHFIYLGVEDQSIKKQEASVIPTIAMSAPEVLTNQIPETSNTDTVVSVESIASEITVETAPNIIEEVVTPVEEVQTITEKVESELISPKTIARYRIEGNANYHASDLNKKGQNANVIKNGEWYEVVIPQ